MAKITLKLNKKDLDRILKKGQALEKDILSDSGAIYTYMLSIGNGYREAVLSGIGKTSTGVLTLKSFLGEPKSVKWRRNANSTIDLKKKNSWSLMIWKATGATEKAVKVIEIKGSSSKEVFAGIDPSKDPEAYEHAIRTEFAAISDPGQKPYEGRALFTLLSAVFAGSTAKIMAEIEDRLAKSIEKHWGR